MSDDDRQPFYASPAAHLQQGDVFRTEVVLPLADSESRIFRTVDGRHGSVALDPLCMEPAKIHHPDELHELLKEAERTPDHTDPFCPTIDGLPEMVVVHASLIRFFVVASQTCDISGVDKSPLHYALIMPARTVQDICLYDRLPNLSRNKEELITIHEFLRQNMDDYGLSAAEKPISYESTLKERVNAWEPDDKYCRERSGLIKNYFKSKLAKCNWMYAIEHDSSMEIPSLYIDFSSIYTVIRQQVEDMKGMRVAQMTDMIRVDFSKSFSEWISRVALIQQPSPKVF